MIWQWVNDKYKLAESFHAVVDQEWSELSWNIHAVQIDSNVKPRMSC